MEGVRIGRRDRKRSSDGQYRNRCLPASSSLAAERREGTADTPQEYNLSERQKNNPLLCMLCWDVRATKSGFDEGRGATPTDLVTEDSSWAI